MAKAKSAVAKAAPKRTKAGKDPNAPKRGMSAYMLWMQANRDKIKEPGMGVTDIAKKAGALWKDVKDKPKWEAKAAEEKKRYEREMADYKKKGGAAGGSTAKAAKKPAKKTASDDDDDDEMDGDSDE